MTSSATLAALASLVAGSLATFAAMRLWDARRGREARRSSVTRLDAHISSNSGTKVTPVKTAALQREAQEVFETREATHDLAVLDRLLRDVRDLTGADEAIFWRWVEARQTLVP